MSLNTLRVFLKLLSEVFFFSEVQYCSLKHCASLFIPSSRGQWCVSLVHTFANLVVSRKQAFSQMKTLLKEPHKIAGCRYKYHTAGNSCPQLDPFKSILSLCGCNKAIKGRTGSAALIQPQLIIKPIQTSEAAEYTLSLCCLSSPEVSYLHRVPTLQRLLKIAFVQKVPKIYCMKELLRNNILELKKKPETEDHHF